MIENECELMAITFEYDIYFLILHFTFGGVHEKCANFHKNFAFHNVLDCSSLSKLSFLVHWHKILRNTNKILRKNFVMRKRLCWNETEKKTVFV